MLEPTEPLVKTIIFSSGNTFSFERTAMQELSEEDRLLVSEEKERLAKLLLSCGQRLAKITKAMEKLESEREGLLRCVETAKKDMTNINIEQLREFKKNAEQHKEELHREKTEKLSKLDKLTLEMERCEQIFRKSSIGQMIAAIGRSISIIIDPLSTFFTLFITMMFFVGLIHLFIPTDITGLCRELETTGTLSIIDRFDLPNKGISHMKEVCNMKKYKIHSYLEDEDKINHPAPFNIILEHTLQSSLLRYDYNLIPELSLIKSYDFVKSYETHAVIGNKSLLIAGVGFIHGWGALCGGLSVIIEMVMVTYKVIIVSTELLVGITVNLLA